ncbi:O-antigen ligase family protein [Bradyrhizobium sp. McL0615]|uniref:O-antigen ligase family protein n=1 Tax=Bradyrhizobium sp. McL0615 TaxID=3415673 RepID=UPI003CF747CD
MSLSATAPPVSLLRRYWRDRALWMTIADVFAILAAFTLPWSTTLPAIFVPLWLGAVAWVMDWRAYGRLLKLPICYLPLALVGLALVGTLWSDAAWSARLYAVSPTLKLLVLPGLFYHFERSSRGIWVFVAFLVSCALLMAVSWLVVMEPSLTLKAPDEAGGRGIFVKNYIDQSQEFALCAVALAYPIIRLLRTNQIWQALVLGAISLGFVVNMAFVIVSRTAMVTIPIMLAVFALLHLKWRTSLVIFGGLAVMAGLAFATSPPLQLTTDAFVSDYLRYKNENLPTSVGLRLEYWRKSLGFFTEAPVIGNGTGSTLDLFKRTATGAGNRATAQVIGNPHNQTLAVAVQWGAAGIILLYAMWLSHLRLFRGDDLASWIGLLVVVQNIFTSLFNSHIFDFHEGWMYVFGVGVAGGMTLAAGQHNARAESAGSS